MENIKLRNFWIGIFCSFFVSFYATASYAQGGNCYPFERLEKYLSDSKNKDLNDFIKIDPKNKSITVAGTVYPDIRFVSIWGPEAGMKEMHIWHFSREFTIHQDDKSTKIAYLVFSNSLTKKIVKKEIFQEQDSIFHRCPK